MQHSKVQVLFVNERYTKWVPFLSKKVYNRVRGQTSEQSLPISNFFEQPPPHPPGTLAEPETVFYSMKQLGPTDIAANIWHYNNEL